MKTIATHEAKTHLSRYLKEVGEGHSFIITRGRTPLAKLVPISSSTSAARPKVGETPDAPMHVPEAALAPLSGSELKEWGL